MVFSDWVSKTIVAMLEDRRILVWYDENGFFCELIERFSVPNVHVVNATGSLLKARREADTVYRIINETELIDGTQNCMLIYIPRARAKGGDERRQDPFSLYALAGASFGAKFGDRPFSAVTQRV